MSDDSVAEWLSALRKGDVEAVQPLWERYFDQLVGVARHRLGAAPRRVMDEEDVALSAFQSFCDRAMSGDFPNVRDRNALWPMLVVITARKAAAYSRHMMRQKRGGGQVRGDSVFGVNADTAAYDFRQLVSTDPSPEFAVQVAEQLDCLLEALDDPVLKTITLKKLEGATTREIADSLSTTERTVRRKLTIVRTVWERHAS